MTVKSTLDSLAKAVASHLINNELSQSELARQTGVSQSTISKLLSGTLDRLQPATLSRLGRALGIPDSEVQASLVSESSTRPKVDLGELEAPGRPLVGRLSELRNLDSALQEGAVRIVAVTGIGGIGKTALVDQWLAELGAEDWKGAELVLGWTFRRARDASPEGELQACLRSVLELAGETALEGLSGSELVREVLDVLQGRKAVLVLDAVEPLQSPAAVAGSRSRDQPLLRTFLSRVARESQAMVVLTTRSPTQEFEELGTSKTSVLALPELGTREAAELLRRYNLEVPEATAHRIAKHLGGHPYSLSLMGRYLAEARGRDWRWWSETSIREIAENLEESLRARELCLAATQGLTPAEHQALRITSMLDPFATERSIEDIRRRERIKGLNEAVIEMSQDQWNLTISKLCRRKVISQVGLTTYRLTLPRLLQEHVLAAFAEESPADSRGACEKVLKHISALVPGPARTELDAETVCAAAKHARAAHLVHWAIDELYIKKLKPYLASGDLPLDHSLELEAEVLASFFDRPWETPNAGLSPAQGHQLLVSTAEFLGRAGRLEAAYKVWAAAKAKAPAKAVGGAPDTRSIDTALRLAETSLLVGRAEAVGEAREAVELMLELGDPNLLATARSLEAAALLQAGELEPAVEALARADVLPLGHQQELFSRARKVELVSLDRGLEVACELLGRAPLPSHALSRLRERSLDILRELSESQGRLGEEHSKPPGAPLDGELHLLVRARARLGLALGSPVSPTEYRPLLSEALAGLDSAAAAFSARSRPELETRALILRARLLTLLGELDSAESDFHRSLSVSSRIGMLPASCEAHLGLCRLSLQRRDREAAAEALTAAQKIHNDIRLGRWTGELRRLRGEVEATSWPGEGPGQEGPMIRAKAN